MQSANRPALFLFPTPYSLFPTPYSLFPIPYSLNSSGSRLRQAPLRWAITVMTMLSSQEISSEANSAWGLPLGQASERVR